MITNKADKEHTIKNSYKMSQYDVWNDKKMHTLCNYRNEFIFQENFILDGYKEILESELVSVKLKDEHKYHPAAFSEYYYGTPDLDFLVMYFSGIHTLLDFNTDYIKVLPESLLRYLLDIVEKNSEVVTNTKKEPNVVYDTTLYRIKGKFRKNIIINGKVL